MSEIYYLLNFHKKCEQIACYGTSVINNYCLFVNKILNELFDQDQQKQLKLYGFNKDVLYEFAYNDVDDISFDNLDKQNLYKLFNKICHVDNDDLYEQSYIALEYVNNMV